MRSVYTIKNLVNGRVYVGKTSYDKYRFYLHINSLRRGKHHSKSLQKEFDAFGEQAFSFQILFDNLEDSEADRMEVFMMKVLKSQNFAT